MEKLSEMKNIEEWPLWLEDVPDYLQTDELCKIAVQQDGCTLEYVYNKLKTEEICKLAVRQNGLALQFMVKDQTDEICKLAV
jgi:hypothetical protein